MECPPLRCRPDRLNRRARLRRCPVGVRMQTEADGAGEEWGAESDRDIRSAATPIDRVASVILHAMDGRPPPATPDSPSAASLARRLFRFDADFAPVELDAAALRKLIPRQPTETADAIRVIRRLAQGMDEQGMGEQGEAARHALLWCALDVAQAADAISAARGRAAPSQPVHPADDAEVQEFLRGLESWPDRDVQPDDVRAALESAIGGETATAGDEFADAARFFMGRSVVELAAGDPERVIRPCQAHIRFLPATAYGYYLPLVIGWELTALPWYVGSSGLLQRMCPVHWDSYEGRGGRLRRFLRSIGLTSGPLRDDASDWYVEGFVADLACYSRLQRETFCGFLRILRGRPELYPDIDEQLMAAVCHHFFWKHRARWAEG